MPLRRNGDKSFQLLGVTFEYEGFVIFQSTQIVFRYYHSEMIFFIKDKHPIGQSNFERLFIHLGGSVETKSTIGTKSSIYDTNWDPGYIQIQHESSVYQLLRGNVIFRVFDGSLQVIDGEGTLIFSWSWSR